MLLLSSVYFLFFNLWVYKFLSLIFLLASKTFFIRSLSSWKPFLKFFLRHFLWNLLVVNFFSVCQDLHFISFLKAVNTWNLTVAALLHRGECSILGAVVCAVKRRSAGCLIVFLFKSLPLISAPFYILFSVLWFHHDIYRYGFTFVYPDCYSSIFSNLEISQLYEYCLFLIIFNLLFWNLSIYMFSLLHTTPLCRCFLSYHFVSLFAIFTCIFYLANFLITCVYYLIQQVLHFNGIFIFLNIHLFEITIIFVSSIWSLSHVSMPMFTFQTDYIFTLSYVFRVCIIWDF